MRTSSTLYAGIALMVIALYAHAFPGESIVRDPVTGNYTITYVGDAKANTLSQTTFVPSTKIAPAIRTSFRLGERSVIMYRYTVFNGATAKQSIVSVVLEQIVNPILGEIPKPSVFQHITQADLDAYVAAETAALASPAGWDGSINRDISNIDWSPKTATFNTGGIHPGQTLSGFGFNSLDLPGMGPSWMAGRVGEDEILGFPDEGPVKKSAVLAELNQLRDNDFIRRNAAVPSIAVPDPFDAAVLLDRIRTHMATWSGKQLVDPAFAAQLDRYLVAAADAYRLNNAKAGREHIETLRKMLAKEHHNMDHDDEDSDDAEERKAQTRFTVDRLAARVLDFDLRYVLKRTEHDHEEGDRKGR
jgi:hypothetical protein